MPLDPTGQFELEENELDRCRGLPGLPDQLVDRNGRRSEQRGDIAPVALARVDRGSRKGKRPDRFADHARIDRPDRFDHVVDILDQRRAFADKSI